MDKDTRRFVGQRYDYWTIKYVPDQARGEFINIGVIVGRDREWAMRTVASFSRAALLGGPVEVITPALDRLRHVIAGESVSDALGNVQTQWLNIVQLDRANPIVAMSVADALNSVWAAKVTTEG